uniref:Uncharacterized protein n=1 Tax=Tetranychus urticae TaxID=32264 RepID=T1KKJ1_TETUR
MVCVNKWSIAHSMSIIQKKVKTCIARLKSVTFLKIIVSLVVWFKQIGIEYDRKLSIDTQKSICKIAVKRS